MKIRIAVLVFVIESFCKLDIYIFQYEEVPEETQENEIKVDVIWSYLYRVFLIHTLNDLIIT